MSDKKEVSIDFLAKNRQDFWESMPENCYKKNTYGAPLRREFIANLIMRNGVESVFEVGCNSGANLLYIKNLCQGIKTVGIDICKEAIEYGKKIEKNKAEFHLGSIYDLSKFKDKEFDIVMSCTVLQHIPSEKVASVLREMKRIAKYFVFSIEDHGNEDKIFWCRDGIPQRWTTNYKEKYLQADMSPVIYPMEDLVPEKSLGGAHYLIYANVGDRKFIV